MGNPLPKCGPSVAGRWPFPPPPWPWAVAGLASEVFPRHRPSPDRSQNPSALVDLISSSELSFASGDRLAPGSPLVGFVLKVPSTDAPFARPLPGAEAPLGPTLPSVRSCSVLVVPPHLDGFLRAEAAGLLHPAIGHGVRRVFGLASPAPEHHPEAMSRRGTTDQQSPRRGSHPSKASPRRQPYRLTTAVALLSLPSCPIPGRRRSDDLFRFPCRPRATEGVSARRSEERGARDAGRRTQLDDAPIRRSGPPRHRARGPRTAEATLNARTGPPHLPGAEAPLRVKTEPPPGLASPFGPPRPSHSTRGRSVRCLPTEAGGLPWRLRRSRRSEWDAGPSSSSRRDLLQGLSPPTSPLPEAAVAGDSLLVPSMGFVPLQGPSCSAPTRPCLVGDPREAEACCVPFQPPSAASRIARAGARDPFSSSPAPSSRSSGSATPTGGRSRAAVVVAFSASIAAPDGATPHSPAAEATSSQEASARRSLSGARSSWSGGCDAGARRALPPKRKGRFRIQPRRPLQRPSWGS